MNTIHFRKYAPYFRMAVPTVDKMPEGSAEVEFQELTSERQDGRLCKIAIIATQFVHRISCRSDQKQEAGSVASTSN